MRYKIVYESPRLLHLELTRGRLSDKEADILYYALDDRLDVVKAQVFPRTGRVSIRVRGDAQALQVALHRFLSGPTTSLQGLQQAHVQGDWSTLAKEAHRLRGVAGNLALQALQALLGQLEQAAKTEQAGQAQACLEALPAAWQAAQQALQACGAVPAPAAATEQALPQAIPVEQVQTLLSELCAALDRGELPEQELLDQLPLALPATCQEPVLEAIDRVDFAQASALLRQWHEQAGA